MRRPINDLSSNTYIAKRVDRGPKGRSLIFKSRAALRVRLGQLGLGLLAMGAVGNVLACPGVHLHRMMPKTLRYLVSLAPVFAPATAK